MPEHHGEFIAFHGTMDRIQLSDLVQVICLAQRNHTIRVESDLGAGVLHARSGQIYHAQLGELQGEDACYEMFRWRCGRFETTHPEVETVTTIGKNWEFLLIEGLRLRNADSVAAEASGGGDAMSVASEGFGGDLNGVLLPDLVQLACMSGTAHVLDIRSGDETPGRIHVREGRVFHAVKGALEGVEAFNDILRWREGEFEEVSPDGEAPVTIERPWEYLLIEATRCQDETSGEGEGDRRETLPQRIQKMRITEKIRAAMAGDKETRSLLIREPNRMIQWAIINNPRLTDGEVVSVANSRSMDEEVLRKIGNTREWIKIYQVRHALATNPKTPLAIATRLLPSLLVNDLKTISRSKSVPQVVAQAARRLMSAR